MKPTRERNEIVNEIYASNLGERCATYYASQITVPSTNSALPNINKVWKLLIYYATSSFKRTT